MENGFAVAGSFEGVGKIVDASAASSRLDLGIQSTFRTAIWSRRHDAYEGRAAKGDDAVEK